MGLVPVRDAGLHPDERHLANRLAALLAHRFGRYVAPFGMRKFGRSQVAVEDSQVLEQQRSRGYFFGAS